MDDHPTEWANIVYADVVRNVLAYSERETRQVQDIRKRYVLNIRQVHVQSERVSVVHLAQVDLAATGKTRDSSVHTAPPPLKSATQSRLRASLAVRMVSAAIGPSAATPSGHPAPIEAGDLECEEL